MGSLVLVAALSIPSERAENAPIRYEELDSLAAAIGHLGNVPSGGRLLVMSASAGWPGPVGDIVIGRLGTDPAPVSPTAYPCYGRWEGSEGEVVNVSAPLPGCVPCGLPLSTRPGERIRFELNGIDTLGEAAVALSSPGMSVEVLHPDSTGGFEIRTPDRGVYWLEVMALGGRGPEVALLVPVISGASPEQVVRGDTRISESRAGSVVEVLSELNSMRLSKGLLPLEYDHRLGAIARSRAVELAVNGGVDHLSDAGGSVRDLLPDGVSFVAENIGRGSGFSEAWSMILISPFHLMSCLSPTATDVGIGASVQIERDSWQLVLVQVLASPEGSDG